jgi:hypothetical protein
MVVDLCELVDLICLVYHEARNVRHLVKSGRLHDAERYNGLIHGLAQNREDAWRQMDALRDRAVRTGSAAGAAAVFQRQYGLVLAELTDLYEKPFWKGSAYGGNAWGPISTKVRDLVSAMAGGDSARARELCEEILSMSHNTGKVAQKLNRLKQS